jgi:GNAT superfamily N-acetyltransferase
MPIMAGIVTVATMLYIEWERLGEIGDLYVLPKFRMKGIARTLVEAAIHRCRSHGCSAITVTERTAGANYRP